jgi:hypothetical protein
MDSWVKHTWKFLYEHGITIEDKVGDIQLKRRGDDYLMRIFTQYGYKGAALKRLNACRLFLQVETVADITMVDGRYIAAWVLEGNATANPITYHTWPNQGDPGRSIWAQWRNAVAQCLCGGYVEHGLLQRLHQWTTRPPEAWQWWYVLQEERIYRYLEARWHFYSVQRVGQRTRSRRFIYGGLVDEADVSERRRRATVRWTGDGILQLTGYSDLETDYDESNPLSTGTLESCISNGDEGWRWAVERFAVADGGRTLAEAIHQGRAIAVSDGSYKDDFGTAAYVLEGETASNRIVCALATPGIPEDQSSFCSELAGLYRIVMMVQAVCHQFGITSGGIEVGCDGLIALQRAFGEDFMVTPDIKDSDYDLLSATRKILAESPVIWTWRHVEGHQDDDGIEELD